MTEVSGSTSGQSEGVVDQAQQKASELRRQGSARIRDQLDTRSTEYGTQAQSFAHALRRSGNDVRTQGSGSAAATVADQAAERIEQLGRYLEQKSGDEMMRDVEQFARRRPWMIAGLGLLAGVAASRFVKASAEQRYVTSRPAPARPVGGYAPLPPAPPQPYARTGIVDETAQPAYPYGSPS